MSRLRDLHAKEPCSPPPLLQKRRSDKISPARRFGSTGFEPEKDLSQNPYTRFSRVSAAVTPNSHKQVFNLLEFSTSRRPVVRVSGESPPCGALTSRCACAFFAVFGCNQAAPLVSHIAVHERGDQKQLRVFPRCQDMLPVWEGIKFLPRRPVKT